MVTSGLTFHVISHTHWDREWYLPFEVFRIELVDLIDNLLDILEQNRDFIFHLDGQSIILQDYLEIKPDKREQIKKFIKSGNLLIGPWYVLSDEFLTSGEATIRNLMHGIRYSNALGGVMLVGYCPDQFGQIAQLPQIFKGFNITSCIVGRGMQDGKSEHIWYGLNGESLLAISLTHWYNNAQRLPVSKEKLNSYLEEIYETQNKTTLSGNILLMNGCDHLYPQKDLPKILNALDGNSKWSIKYNGLPEALKIIEENTDKNNLPIRFGELRDDNNKYILSGTLSSRVYLKLENYKNETKLEKIIEPLAALLAIKGSAHYPYEQIKYAWQLLFQNHAHDSICGCSIDEVHKEMEMRFLKVGQVVDKVNENLLSCLDNDGHLYLQLINLSAYNRSDIIEADLEFPLGPAAEHPYNIPTENKPEIKTIILKDKEKNIDCKIIENKKSYKMVRSRNEVPLLQAVQKIKILFQAEIKPFSINSFEILTDSKDARAIPKQFENKNYKLNITQEGTISVLLKNTNDKFENLHFFSIEDDLGDQYNFVPQGAYHSQPSPHPFKWDTKTIEENTFRKRFLLLAKEKDLEIEIQVTCYRHSNRIDFKTRINNKLKNKRIRLHFPTNLNTNYISADTPFGTLQRARPPVDWINYAYSQPIYNWLDHNNNSFGLAFFSSGLADYELYEDGNGFTITLIRGVGRLSTVKSHSLIETPDAQCMREIIFSYAILPHMGSWEEAGIQNEELIYQTPLVTNQSNKKTEIKEMIEVTSPLLVSTFKRSEDKQNTYILRIFNPLDKLLKNCNISLNFPIKKLCMLNLNEDILSTINNFKGQLDLEVKPYQILTLGIEI